MTDLDELLASADPAAQQRRTSADDASRIYQIVHATREHASDTRPLGWRYPAGRSPRRVLVAAFCAAVVAGAVLLTVDVSTSPQQPVPAEPPNHLAPLADVAATPAGWVTVPFEVVQVSVPESWFVERPGSNSCSAGPGTQGTVFLGEDAASLGGGCAPNAATVSLTPAAATPVPHAHRTVVHGIAVVLGWTSGPSGRTYLARALGVDIAAWGSDAQAVLATLTHSPLSVVLGSWSSTVPAGWRSYDFGGLTVTVPPTWSLNNDNRANFDVCSPTVIRDELTLQRVQPEVASCPLFSRGAGDEADADGLRIAAGAFVANRITGVGPCRQQRDLRICITQPTANSYLGFSVLEAAVYVPGQSLPDLIDLGLAGSGLTALEVFDSLHASGS